MQALLLGRHRPSCFATVISSKDLCQHIFAFLFQSRKQCVHSLRRTIYRGPDGVLLGCQYSASASILSQLSRPRANSNDSADGRGEVDSSSDGAEELDAALRASKKGIFLSRCAADHFLIVQSLTAAQLNARYSPACLERWGPASNSPGHVYCADQQPGIPLKAVLQAHQSPCQTCDSDCDQFFSFCLNRIVNKDRVEHCHQCGKCYYFRPGLGVRACPHCGFGNIFYGDDGPLEAPHPTNVRKVVGLTGVTKREAIALLKAGGGELFLEHVESARGCNVPDGLDDFEYRFASEGYWGF